MKGDSAATPPERLGRFFAAIEEKLVDGREANQRQCRELFHQLEPRLAAARELDRELNHHLAHRFNVFRYLRDDELGLSRIIADLLDPKAAHGQGPQFLRLFLGGLSVNLSFSDTELSEATVVVEHPIEENRRIDIYVKISSGGKRYCLAIENKPYAGDQYEQVKDYLKHLAARFDPDSFHLIYLSPTGEPPSEKSLPKAELTCWHGRLLIMPYHHRHTDEDWTDREGKRDEFRDFRTPSSLTQWLADCRAQCEAQRLRWFLDDAESYCRRTFGDTDMASDLETKTVLELLESEPNHLETARVVYESWPAVRDRICEEFLKHLCDRMGKGLKEFKQDIRVEPGYEGRGTGALNRLSIYRPSWPEHQDEDSVAQGRTAIRLRAGTGNSWTWYGVWSPNRTLEGKLRAAFPDFKAPDDGYPVWRYVESGLSDWDQMASKLAHESKAIGGKITDFYVETLVEFAQRAIPIIDEVESS